MTDIANRGYASPEVLVSTAWVAEHLNDPSVRIVESNEDRLLYRSGHLPGAVNIPLRALAARLSELDPAQEVVAYCRGAYCVLSYEAVAALRARGFTARRLEDGLPEWRAAGLPVVTGAA